MTILQFNATLPLSIKLKLLRIARGLEQADLMNATGLDRSVISRYEHGLIPTQDHLEKLETFFNISLDDPQIDNAARILAGIDQPEPIAA